jgi:hypothetical protein
MRSEDYSIFAANNMRTIDYSQCQHGGSFVEALKYIDSFYL